MQEQSTSEQHPNKGLVAVVLIVVLLAAGAAIWYSRKGAEQQPAQGNTSEVSTPSQPTTPTADEQKAIDLVKAKTEVQTWLKLFSGPDNTSLETKGKATVDVDHNEDGLISVHVYETLNDHTATFGWYSVDSKTWKVTKDL